MKKIFVLDTNVLIHDPEAFLHFAENDVVLPITVIEELDKMKRGNGEIPYSARQALRLLDHYRETGKLSSGVNLPNEGTLRVEIKEDSHLHKQSNDNRIISTAVTIANNGCKGQPVILVSKDTSVRIKADSLGLITQDYLKDKTTVFQKFGNVHKDESESADIHSVRYLQSGDLKEKLHPWMQPIYDNLDVIVGTSDEKIDNKDTDYRSSDYLIESDIIHIEPLTYIRGRSLPRRFLIIDEAQNLRPLDVKTIITRCGEGTKVVFTGDLEQIDSPFLDAASNGLAYLINRFIQEENFCYLNMKQSARSALAEQAAELL